MNINLITDAPKHNHALMKISTYHKKRGDSVYLNNPLFGNDLSYCSLLFDGSVGLLDGDRRGGPAFWGDTKIQNVLPNEMENCKPDYDLFGTNYSLGYSFRPCFRLCSFCNAGKFDRYDDKHHSIWDFHDTRFNKICLLNNNTFFDKNWKETFEEIWDADLTMIDENGYDIRLIDDEKAIALKRTKFDGKIHFAWDRIKDESKIIEGLSVLKKYKIKGTFYILINYDTTEVEDIHRCQVLKDHGQDFYVMPYGGTVQGKKFKRFVDTFMWRKYKTIKEAWKNYKP